MSKSPLPILAGKALTLRDHLADAGRWFTGIDLGTTNSSVAIVDAHALRDGRLDEAVRLIAVRQPTEDGEVDDTLLPSVVAEVEPDLWWIGRGAKEARRRGLGRNRQLFYSTKSEMGVGREPLYPLAPPSLNTPHKVAAKVLTTLCDAARSEVGPEALENVVVTVPASFQLAARKDTFRAAEYAGVAVREQSLLDEPNAALLDYLLTVAPREPRQLDLQKPRAVLVFDFGGGTCDVSIVRVQTNGELGRLQLSNLAISRYERLGGDNIDAAIAEHILLPDLLKENKLGRLELTWAQKRDFILPQLLSAAEQVKERLVEVYRKALASGREVGKSALLIGHPAVTVAVPSPSEDGGSRIQTYVLPAFSVSLPKLEAVLAPFLDQDFLFQRGTEMNEVLSIFAPVADALERAGLSAQEIDGVLLAGGSSLMPQVQDALQSYFPKATLLRFPNDARTIAAVARGAALHSFFLHALGAPLLQPIAQETIGILTREGGFAPLIPAGTPLPFPADGSFARYDGLVVPHTLINDIEIVLAADGPAKVLTVGHLPAQVGGAGEPIDVRFRLDSNKLLTVRATLPSDPDAACDVTLDNPLCPIGVRSERESRILELEQRAMAAGAGTGASQHTQASFEELTWLHMEEGHYERALDAARTALRLNRRPDASMLNAMASCYIELDQPDRAEECYGQAIEAAPGWAASWFNRSRLRLSQKRYAEALDDVDEALRLVPGCGGYFALRSSVLEGMGSRLAAEQSMEDATAAFEARPPRTDFERYWARRVGERTRNPKLSQAASTPPAEEATPAYDPKKLPAERAGVLARRA